MTIDKTTMTTILVVNKTAAISRSPISHLTEFLAIRIASLTCAYSVTDYRLLEFRNFLQKTLPLSARRPCTTIVRVRPLILLPILSDC